MSAKKELKSEKATPDSEKTLNQQIAEHRDQLNKIHASLALHFAVKQSASKAAEVNTLQDRLEFRVKNYELQLLKEKIDIFGQVLKVLQK